MKSLLAFAALSLATVPFTLAPSPQDPVPSEGLIDFNVATTAELLALPGMTQTVADALIAERPFEPRALDGFLANHELDEFARDEIYAKAFVQLDLNRGAEADYQLIPGVGEKMAHELVEYRPWKSWKQFDKEIGKYVDELEVARLRQYLFIPLDLNEATEEQFTTIPGVGERMAHEFVEYRPWKSKAQFEKEIGKYVDAKEVARLWRYVVIASDEG